MKKPILPTKPVQPKEPTKEFDEIHQVSLLIHTGCSFEYVLEQGEKHYLKITESELKDFKFAIDGYDDGPSCSFEGKIVRKKILTDVQWDMEQKRYAKKLEDFNNKMSNYIKSISQYYKDIIEWEKWDLERIKQNDLVLLEKLKIKYNK